MMGERLRKLERDSQPTSHITDWSTMRIEDELAKQGIEVENKNYVDTFKSCDIVLIQLRNEIRKIDRCIIALIVASFMFEIIFAIFSLILPR